MGHRLSKIYTRTGDDGSTSLADGSRIDKDSPRVEAMGAVDELNSALGLLLAETPVSNAVWETLTGVQHKLFDLGGELSLPQQPALTDADVAALERALDNFNAQLPPLKEFILPGGSRCAALCHVARAVCRRAERRVRALAKTEDVSPAALRYLNRLSDLLFVCARILNQATAQTDVLWKRDPE